MGFTFADNPGQMNISVNAGLISSPDQVAQEIQDILKTLHSANAELSGFIKSFSKDSAAKLKSMAFDPEALSQRKLPYERLDQLVTELLLGVI